VLKHKGARGYVVSTVGIEIEVVKRYIAQQEQTEKENEEGRF
jgi:REP element-mobilizing transposase RayT